MNIKRCAECDKIYAPTTNSGAAFILCRFCVVDCEMAYAPVRRYISTNSFSTVDQIAQGSGISPALVKGLILEGRFEGESIQGLDEMITQQRKHQALHMIRDQDKASAQAQARQASARKSTDGGKSYGLGRS